MRTAAYLVVCLALCSALPVDAQILTGNIIGTIRDTSGAVLPGATATVTSPARPAGPLTVVTDASGQYRFPGLPPGTYTLTVSLEGFSQYEEVDLRVIAGGTVERIVTLKLASVSETITVSGQSPVVDPRNVGMQSNLSSEVIEQIPTRRFSVFDYMKWAPGTYADPNARSTAVAVMGASSSENLTQLDGLNINFATSGGANQYPDPDIVQEMNVVTLGASAEYAQAQGAVFQVITKSGTNVFKYDAAGFWQPNGFTSKPIKLDCACPGQTGFARVKYVDYTTHSGGPIRKDRLWFYGGAAFHDEWTSQPGTNPVTPQKYRDYNPFVKITWQINDRLRFFETYDDDFWLIPGTPTIANPASTLTQQGGFNPGFASELNGTLSSTTYLTAQVAGWWYQGWKTRPVLGDLTTPNHTDTLTGLQSGGAGQISNSYSHRWDVRVKLAHYKRDWLGGNHDFKVGVQTNNGFFSTRNTLIGGVNYSDVGGLPDQATFRDPWVSGAATSGPSAFAEDSVTIRDRLTISAGYRFDHVLASSPELPATNALLQETSATVRGLATQFPRNLHSPRLGFNLKATEDGKTVVRGSYGRSYRALFTGDLTNLHPGLSPTTTKRFDPATGGYTILLGVVDPVANLAVDPNLEVPLTDEYSIGVDRELLPGVGLNVTYAHRNAKQQTGWTDVGAIYGTQTVALANGQNLVVYPRLSSAASSKFLLTNPPDYYSRYNGLVLAVQKRFSRHWQANISYTASKQEGVVLTGTNGRDPNDLIDAGGRLSTDRPHVVKVQASVEVPKADVLIATAFTGQLGPPFAAAASVRLPQGTRTINIEPVGGHRYSTQKFLDLRVSKFVRLGAEGRKIELVANVQNALQNEAYTSVVTRNFFTANFGVPSVYTEPRRLLLGTKFAW